MCAARLMKPRAIRGLALGVAVFTLAVLTLTAAAQTSPSSIGVLVEQVLALFPKVDGDVLEVKDQTVTLSLGKKDGLAAPLEDEIPKRAVRTGAEAGYRSSL